MTEKMQNMDDKLEGLKDLGTLLASEKVRQGTETQESRMVREIEVGNSHFSFLTLTQTKARLVNSRPHLRRCRATQKEPQPTNPPTTMRLKQA